MQAIDDMVSIMVQSGLTEQQARSSIKLRWAINRETGAEVGRVSDETRAEVESYWAAVDAGEPVPSAPEPIRQRYTGKRRTVRRR